MDKKIIYYECDGKVDKCDKTQCGNCKHTSDIAHAKNFKIIGNTSYFEESIIPNRIFTENNKTRRVDDFGRIMIPKQIRERLNIKEGDELEVLWSDDGVYFRKAVSNNAESENT